MDIWCNNIIQLLVGIMGFEKMEHKFAPTIHHNFMMHSLPGHPEPCLVSVSSLHSLVSQLTENSLPSYQLQLAIILEFETIETCRHGFRLRVDN